MKRREKHFCTYTISRSTVTANENNYGVKNVTVGPGLGGEEAALSV